MCLVDNRRFGYTLSKSGYGASLTDDENEFVGRKDNFLTTDLEVFGLPRPSDWPNLNCLIFFRRSRDQVRFRPHLAGSLINVDKFENASGILVWLKNMHFENETFRKR